MSAVLLRRRTGRALARAPFFAVVLTLLLGCLLTHPRAAGGQTDDAVPTWWHEAAGLTPLLTAPPPPSPATICLIDTGVTPTPDLDITARWAYDGGTLDDVRATEDSPGHGTLVAHFAAGAVNGWGGAGAFPQARISSVRVFPREGGASWREYIAAISRCSKLDPNTKVIVISIGGQDIAPGEADELAHWIGRAGDRYDINVVAAAGNDPGAPDYPARLPAAFAVAATAPDGRLCAFSARGPEVDLSAPGCDLDQADARGETWLLNGTSFAAPLAAGAIAALRAYAPAVSARDAERLLTHPASGTGTPSLNAAAAIARAGVSLAPDQPASPPPVRDADRPPAPASGSASGAAAGTRGPRMLARPRVRVHRSDRRVLLRIGNRPRGAAVDVVAADRRFRRRAARVAVPARARRARCRFVRNGMVSAWTAVRW